MEFSFLVHLIQFLKISNLRRNWKCIYQRNFRVFNYSLILAGARRFYSTEGNLWGQLYKIVVKSFIHLAPGEQSVKLLDEKGKERKQTADFTKIIFIEDTLSTTIFSFVSKAECIKDFCDG